MEETIIHLLEPTTFLTTNFWDSILGNIISSAGEYTVDGILWILSGLISLLLWVPYYIIVASVWLLDSLSHFNISSEVLSQGWDTSIFFVNILAIFFLITLAFANALRLNIETYEIKKTLPALIVGFVLANLSFFIISVLLDISDLVVQQLNSGFDPSCPLACRLLEFTTGIPLEYTGDFPAWPKIADNPTEEILEGVGFVAILYGVSQGIGLGNPAVTVPAFIILVGISLLLLILPAILIFLLALIMVARYIILFILITLAPLAIIIYSFPPTRSLGQKWLEQLFLWIFLAPAIFFILYIASFFGDEQEFINLGYNINQFQHMLSNIYVNNIIHPLIETVHAAERTSLGEILPGLSPSVYFYAFIKYAAGVTILFAALFIPFQIGGFGQSIISGLRDLGKKGGWAAWESGGLKEQAGYLLETGKIKGGTLPFIKNDTKIPFKIGEYLETMGKGRATLSAKKTRAGKDLDSAQRYNNIEATEKAGDKKNVARLRDTSMQTVQKDSWTEEIFVNQLEQLATKDGWAKLLRGEVPTGDVQESASNIFGALQTITQSNQPKEKREWAQNLLNKYMHGNGLAFDDYMNIEGPSNPNNYSTNIGLAKNKLGLSGEALVEIAKTPEGQAQREDFSHIPAPTANNPNGIITDSFEKYNKKPDESGKCTNVNNLYKRINAQANATIKDYTGKLAAGRGSITTGELEKILGNLNEGNDVSYAKRLAQNAGAKKLDELISKMHTDNGRLLNPENNINNYTIKQSIQKLYDAKKHAEKNITNSGSFRENGYTPPANNPASQVIYNEVKNTYNSVKDSSDFEKARVAYSNAISHDTATGETTNHDNGVTQFFAAPTSTTFKKEFVPGNTTVIKMIEKKAKPTDIVKELKQQGKLEELKPYMAMFVNP